MNNSAVELGEAFDLGPLIVVEDARAVQENMAAVLNDLRLASLSVCLADFDEPFTSLLLPVAPDDFSGEDHVLTQLPHLAYGVEVLPDISRV